MYPNRCETRPGDQVMQVFGFVQWHTKHRQIVAYLYTSLIYFVCLKPCKQSISKQFWSNNHGDHKYINITHIYVPSTPPNSPLPLAKKSSWLCHWF